MPQHADTRDRTGGARTTGGATEPAPEEPRIADLRLLLPAAAAWAAAAAASAAPWRAVVALSALGVAAAAAALPLRRLLRGARSGGAAPGGRCRRTGGRAANRGEDGRAGRGGRRDQPRRRGVGRWSRSARATLAGTLLCAVAGAAVAAGHVAERRRGPVPVLAARHATVVLHVEVTGDPVRRRPRLTGATRGAPFTVVPARAERVALTAPPGPSPTSARSGPDIPPGRAGARVRTPVKILVRGRRHGARRAAAHPPGQRGTPGRRPGADAGWERLLPSTRVAVRGRLEPPQEPQYGEPVAAVLRVRGTPRVVAGPSAVQRAAGTLRAGLRRATAGLPGDARALLPGLVVGDTARVPQELDDAFRAADLTHLMAVSGANLSVLLAVLLGAAGTSAASRAAARRGLAARAGLPLRATAVSGAALVVGFVVLCRPDPSVLRAAAVGMLALLALATGRRRAGLAVLAAAVLLLVLFAPRLVGSYGFLLSVLATGALLTLGPRWAAALRRRGVPGVLADLVGAAAAAQAVCAPVLVLLAAQVSLVAVPCNLLVEPAVAPATVLGFAALAVAPVWPGAAAGAAWLASWPTRWIAAVARHGAALPGAVVPWPPGVGGAALLLAAAGVGAAVAVRVLPRLRPRSRRALAAGAALLLVLVVVRPPTVTRVVTGWPPPGWRMVACDVGQGDALVLSTGRPGTAVVVDAGPDPVKADRCLRRLGVRRVPLLVLTHFHADHVSGVPGVLKGRSVGAVEASPVDEPPGGHARVARWAARAHVPLTTARTGERRTVGSLSWRVLWPHAAGGEAGPGAAADGGTGGAPASSTGRGGDGSAANNASVAMLARSGDVTLALLGDLEPPAQQQLLEEHPELRAVDVLKVPHHGSGYQYPPLLGRLRPRLALISCGTGNPYGHPAPRTLRVLRGLGATVLRTDTAGALAVTGGHAGLRAVPTG